MRALAESKAVFLRLYELELDCYYWFQFQKVLISPFGFFIALVVQEMIIEILLSAANNAINRKKFPQGHGMIESDVEAVRFEHLISEMVSFKSRRHEFTSSMLSSTS
jgi:hypothetical protein